MAAKPKTPAKKPSADAVKKAADKAEVKAAAKRAKDAEKQQAASGKAQFKKTINEDGDKALFLHHLPKIAAGKKAIADATNALRTLYKTAKIDGFLKIDFDTAAKMQEAEGEKNKKAAIARDLTIAKWLGFDLGSQLDLFAEPERVPAVERAFAEGETASMTGKPANPDYHPSTPQHASYMKGFHDHQATLHKGFKKLEPVEDGAPPFEATDPVTSGVQMTRSDFQKQQAEGHKAN